MRYPRPLRYLFDRSDARASCCARALSDFTAYHLSHKVGLIDALVAACAVGRNATLCTFNVKHYRIIPDLSLEQPYRR